MVNETPETVMLRAKIMHHIRHYGESIACAMNMNQLSHHWKNQTANHNLATDRFNSEYHFGKVQELAAEWFTLTGERFPLPMFLQVESGEYDKNNRSIFAGTIAKV